MFNVQKNNCDFSQNNAITKFLRDDKKSFKIMDEEKNNILHLSHLRKSNCELLQDAPVNSINNFIIAKNPSSDILNKAIIENKGNTKHDNTETLLNKFKNEPIQKNCNNFKIFKNEQKSDCKSFIMSQYSGNNNKNNNNNNNKVSTEQKITKNKSHSSAKKEDNKKLNIFTLENRNYNEPIVQKNIIMPKYYDQDIKDCENDNYKSMNPYSIEKCDSSIEKIISSNGNEKKHKNNIYNMDHILNTKSNYKSSNGVFENDSNKSTKFLPNFVKNKIKEYEIENKKNKDSNGLKIMNSKKQIYEYNRACQNIIRETKISGNILDLHKKNCDNSKILYSSLVKKNDYAEKQDIPSFFSTHILNKYDIVKICNNNIIPFSSDFEIKMNHSQIKNIKIMSTSVQGNDIFWVGSSDNKEFFVGKNDFFLNLNSHNHIFTNFHILIKESHVHLFAWNNHNSCLYFINSNNLQIRNFKNISIKNIIKILFNKSCIYIITLNFIYVVSYNFTKLNIYNYNYLPTTKYFVNETNVIILDSKKIYILDLSANLIKSTSLDLDVNQNILSVSGSDYILYFLISDDNNFYLFFYDIDRLLIHKKIFISNFNSNNYNNFGIEISNTILIWAQSVNVIELFFITNQNVIYSTILNIASSNGAGIPLIFRSYSFNSFYFISYDLVSRFSAINHIVPSFPKNIAVITNVNNNSTSYQVTNTLISKIEFNNKFNLDPHNTDYYIDINGLIFHNNQESVTIPFLKQSHQKDYYEIIYCVD